MASDSAASILAMSTSSSAVVGIGRTRPRGEGYGLHLSTGCEHLAERRYCTATSHSWAPCFGVAVQVTS
jgi:hypothetical protein